MSNPPANKKIEGEIDRFSDIFHVHGDDIDENDDADIDFDQFFTDFDKNDRDDDNINQKEFEVIQEQPTERLSQRLSQLATSNVVEQLPPTLSVSDTTMASVVQKRPALTPTTPTSSVPRTTTKKFKPVLSTGVISGQQRINERGEEEMPKYLSHAEKTFEEIIIPQLPQMASSMTEPVLIEELRQMAFLEHKLQMVHLDISLYTVYLQSGTGTLKKQVDQRSLLQQLQTPAPIYPCVWPEKLKSIIMADPEVHPQDKTVLDHALCLNYVNRLLHQFHEQYQLYQTQLEEKRQRLRLNITSEIEQSITNFVNEHGLTLPRIITEGFIAAVDFTYMDRMLEMEFQRETSNREHFKAFQALTKAKTTLETATMEVVLLKQRVAHQHLSSFFESFQIPIPTVFDTIQDETNRQRLVYRYEQLIQRTKSEMIAIQIRAADIKMEEQKKQFEKDLKEFYHKQRVSYSSDQFSTKMEEIMKQRFKLIEERHKTLLDLKVRFFVKAPTVNNNNNNKLV